MWIIVRSSLFSVEGRVLQSVPRVSLNTIKHVLTLVRTVHIKNTKNVSITAPVDTKDMNHIVLKRVLSTISSINQIIYVSTSARVLNIINRKMYSVWIPVQKKRLKLIRHAYLIVPKVDHFYTRCHVLQNVLFRPSILNRKRTRHYYHLYLCRKMQKNTHCQSATCALMPALHGKFCSRSLVKKSVQIQILWKYIYLQHM